MAENKALDPLIKYLEDATGMEVTQAALGKIMGISDPTYRKRKENGYNFSADEIIAVGRHFAGLVNMADLLARFDILTPDEYIGTGSEPQDFGQVATRKELKSGTAKKKPAWFSQPIRPEANDYRKR